MSDEYTTLEDAKSLSKLDLFVRLNIREERIATLEAQNARLLAGIKDLVAAHAADELRPRMDEVLMRLSENVTARDVLAEVLNVDFTK